MFPIEISLTKMEEPLNTFKFSFKDKELWKQGNINKFSKNLSKLIWWLSHLYESWDNSILQKLIEYHVKTSGYFWSVYIKAVAPRFFSSVLEQISYCWFFPRKKIALAQCSICHFREWLTYLKYNNFIILPKWMNILLEV